MIFLTTGLVFYPSYLMFVWIFQIFYGSCVISDVEPKNCSDTISKTIYQSNHQTFITLHRISAYSFGLDDSVRSSDCFNGPSEVKGGITYMRASLSIGHRSLPREMMTFRSHYRTPGCPEPPTSSADTSN